MRKLVLLATIGIAACSDATGPSGTALSALVNGTQFAAMPSPTGQIGEIDTTNLVLTISGIQQLSLDFWESLVLSIHGFHGAGRYQTCGQAPAVGVFYRTNQPDTSLTPVYSSDMSCDGEVDVQSAGPSLLNPGTYEISGTFHFNGTSTVTTDTAHVTDGRFSGHVVVQSIIVDFPRQRAMQRH